MKRAPVTLVALAVILLLIGAVIWRLWSVADGRAGADAEVNVLLITLDTTRADHLGCYGHPQAVTPNIDQLAREGMLFRQCFTSTPTTLPSHASIMTGALLFVHGARTNVQHELPDANVTLAELLAEQAARATGHREPTILDTLAAAQAEAGLFDQAVQTARGAIELATAAGQTPVADEIRARLDLYRRNTPVRDK